MMYKSESGIETIKIIFESFHPSQFVASNGVDAFVDVLNFEEKKRDKKIITIQAVLAKYNDCKFSLINHACNPDVMYGPKYNGNDRLKVFASNLDDILGKYDVTPQENQQTI
ncbi:hypothetical protein Hanom_Chr12g01127671 [Helianthus anomalus]